TRRSSDLSALSAAIALCASRVRDLRLNITARREAGNRENGNDYQLQQISSCGCDMTNASPPVLDNGWPRALEESYQRVSDPVPRCLQVLAHCFVTSRLVYHLGQHRTGGVADLGGNTPVVHNPVEGKLRSCLQ